MSDISLLYDGYEIIQDTILDGTYFESIAGGTGGQCHFRVKDADNIDGAMYGFDSDRIPVGTFRTGLVIELRIDSQLVWSGVTTSVSREYVFDVDDTSQPSTHQRYWLIEGMDWNVLFTKRVVWNVADPTDSKFASFTGTEQDGDVVKQIMSDFMDLSGDGISDAGVQTTGPLSPFSEPFNIGNPGNQWGEVMNLITANNGTIYYIDPDKVLQYRDVEVATAPYALSDQPSADDNAVGYREMQYWLSAEQLANDVLMWGAGKGNDQMVFARVTDAETADLYGVFQYSEMATDVWKQETIDLRAESYVYGSPTSRRGHRDPQPMITVTVFTPGFRVGQVVDFHTHVFDEDFIGGFTVTDPGTTVAANVDNFADRIKHIESNNNYTDQNKSSGAYGAYQIMPGNWRVWGPLFLGTSRADAVSSKWTDGATWIPATTTGNQDTVAKAKFSRLHVWLGDWRRVAAFWRAGSECIRQPAEWSTGTILYVNHACVPLGYAPVTPATILPALGLGSTGNDADLNDGIGYTPNVSGEYALPIRHMEITFPTPTDAMFKLTLGDVFDRGFLGIDPTGDDPPPVPPDNAWWTDNIPVPVTSSGFGSFPSTNGGPPVGSIFRPISYFIRRNEDGQAAGFGGGVYSSVGIKNGFLAQVTWPFAHCGGIGLGAYDKYEDCEQWTKIIDENGITREQIVANGVDYEITLGTMSVQGHVPSLKVGIAYGAPAAGRYDTAHYFATITVSEPEPPNGIPTATRSVNLNSVVLPSTFFDSTEAMWLVITPGWDAQRDGYYCDPSYWSGPIACWAQGPRCTGEGNSGVVSLSSFTPSDAAVFAHPNNLVDGATWYGPAPEGQSTIYRTQYPYITGTLTVQLQGITLTDAHEYDPPNGLFVLSLDNRDKTETLTVRYQRADVVVTNPTPPQVPPGEPGDPYTPPPGNPTGSAYRPANQRQFGWGTIYDSTNCNMACAAMALDRHTLGQYTRFRGSPQNIPPNMRIYSGNHGLSGTGHDDTQRAWTNGWSQSWTYGGPSSWSSMVANIQSGRGCTVFGRYAYMAAGYKKSRTYDGAHAIYINEQLSDGSFWGYDPIVGYPIVYPYSVLQTYAESYYGFSGRTASGFTRVTPNI